MLDQPVTTPLTNNPKVNQNKIFAALGIILVVAVLVLGGLWMYWNAKGMDKNNSAGETSTKATTTSAKPATTSATTDETADWKTYTSNKIGYSIKYPDFVSPGKETIASSDQNYSVTNFDLSDSNNISVSKNTGSLGKAEYNRLNSYEVGKAVELKSAEAPTVTYTRQEDTKIDGNLALREEWVSNDSGTLIYGYEIWMLKDGNYFQISTTVQDDKDTYTKNKATLDLMAPTFKFL